MANGDTFTGPWYPWYPEKALTSEKIAGLTLAEEGAYRRALDMAWIKGSIPADPKDAAKVIGNGCTVKVATRVLELFAPKKGDRKRVVNLPQERIRAEQREKHAKRVEAGKKRRAANPNGINDQTSNAPPKQQQNPTDKELELEIDKEEKKEEVAANAAPNPRADLWKIGKKVLSDAGEKDPGGLVGKMVSEYGEDAVITALSATIAKTPASPKQYMFGILRSKKNGNGGYVGRSEDPPEESTCDCQWRDAHDGETATFDGKVFALCAKHQGMELAA